MCLHIRACARTGWHRRGWADTTRPGSPGRLPARHLFQGSPRARVFGRRTIQRQIHKGAMCYQGAIMLLPRCWRLLTRGTVGQPNGSPSAGRLRTASQRAVGSSFYSSLLEPSRTYLLRNL
jgi:hypothetical protein